MSFKPPWYRIAYVVTRQSCTYDAPVKGCPTADNVRVDVDLQIVFNINNPENFVFKLGATHFDELLSGAVDEGMRILVREQTHENIYSLRGTRADRMILHLNNKFEDTGVIFANCTVTTVTLPPTLIKSLRHTTEMRKAMEKSKREQEFELGEIQRSSQIQIEELKRKNEQVIVTMNGNKKRAELEHEQRTLKANETREIQIIEAKQKSQVKSMEVKATLERTKVNLEKFRVEEMSKAEAEAQAQRVQADVFYQSTVTQAEAEMQNLQAQAKSILLDAEAEKSASTNLAQKRKFELEIREKEILTKLAEKGNFNLIGEYGDKVIEGLVAGQVQGTSSKK